MKGFENINISEHCKQRYVERIKDITDRQELRRYIVLYEQDIIQNIRKMLQFGEIIYTGKNFEAKDNKIIHIILNGAWLVFVGKDSRKAGIKESKKSLDVYLNEIDLKRRDIISRLICKKAM